MSQSEEWANQRLTLLRKHVQEWKNHTTEEAQARNELISEYQVEKDHIHQKGNALEWANYLVLHVERLTNLSIDNQQQRQIMRTRQEEETANLEERIGAE